MSEPKRQHYVPRFYLANFCREDGRLWLRDTEKQQNRRDRPENVAVINHYYSVEKDGEHDNTIEKGLAELEAAAVPLISDLAAGKQLHIESKDIFSVYAAFQWLRVPDFERSVNKMGEHVIRRTMDVMFHDEEDVKKSLQEFSRKTGRVIEKGPKEMLKFLRSENLKIEIKRSLSLEMMLKQADTMANIFRQMDWLILHAKGDCSFVTSDNPLVLCPPKDFPKKAWYGYGIATPGCKKVFPLTQSSCLLMLDKGEAIFHQGASKAEVRGINRFLASQVCRFLFARDETLINNLKTIADEAGQKRDGRVTIN
jgi:hypothetical protein